jgi:NAD(P)-dependent dehydrogenase (short-subunit alcohol dehydrogenase family)
MTGIFVTPSNRKIVISRLASQPVRWHGFFMANELGNRSFARKVALVTGAASGIGRAVAERLAEAGAKVALADLDEPKVARIADTIRNAGGNALALRLDVTSEVDWKAGMERLLREWGRLDISVNSAGIAFANPIPDTHLADWKRVLSTNLDGVFLGTRQAMTAMKDGGGGCIINIASAAGIKPVAGNAVYGTSKAAILFFTRVAALEGAPLKIRVNSISPGAVATAMWESTPFWPKQAAESGGVDEALKVLVRDHGFAEPEEIAAAVLYLASDDARHVSGADLPVDNGFSIT